MPLRIIPDRGQLSENSIQSPIKQRCHVFQQDVFWAQLSNHANDLEKEAGSFTVEAITATGKADVLARPTGCDDVNVMFGSSRTILSRLFPTADRGLPFRPLFTLLQFSFFEYPASIDIVGVGKKRTNVSPSSDVGPVLCQNSCCVVVIFHLPGTLELSLSGYASGTFQTDIQTADAGEQ